MVLNKIIARTNVNLEEIFKEFIATRIPFRTDSIMRYVCLKLRKKKKNPVQFIDVFFL